jgi:(R,R)-butanediol dehydrogenase/meso-butanediol dehydrogenase/diacetyl reductase
VKAAVFRGAGDIRVEDVSPPEAGPGDVIVTVEACGICGSDLHAYEHGRFVRPGQVMGHEFSGRIAAAGARVEGLRKGDRVAILPYASCGCCAACRRDLRHLCRDVTSQSIAYGRPGAFADEVLVPDAVVGRNVHVLPTRMSFATAALAEPLAVALHAIRLSDLPPGATVAVTGLGPIGLLAVAALRHRRADRIIGADTLATRRDSALALGASDVIDPVATPLRDFVRRERLQLDVAFDASGSVRAVENAIEALRPGGRLVALAIYADELRINPSRLVQLELTLNGSFAATVSDFDHALELLHCDAVPEALLVSHRFSLSEASAAFAAQADRASSLKVMILPQQGSTA